LQVWRPVSRRSEFVSNEIMHGYGEENNQLVRGRQ
jgi:hypothetical protein